MNGKISDALDGLKGMAAKIDVKGTIEKVGNRVKESVGEIDIKETIGDVSEKFRSGGMKEAIHEAGDKLKEVAGKAGEAVKQSFERPPRSCHR